MTENFYQYTENRASGAQPTEAEITELKKAGFEVIFNISTSSAKNAIANEASIVEKSGMFYVHFPVDCSDLQSIHYNTFSGIMNGISDKKVFVHCGANIKSSNLIHMYDVLECGKDEYKSLQTLYQIQQPEDKWFSYFKAMGMQGIR